MSKLFAIIKEQFALGRFGISEFLIVLIMILCRYKLFGIPAESLALFIVLIVNIIKNKKQAINPLYRNAIIAYLIFTITHDFVWLFIAPDIPNYFINNRIFFIFAFVILLNVPKNLDVKSLKSAIGWVTLICVIGMFYQSGQLAAGAPVRPLNIPLIPFEISREGEALMEFNRPSSFFIEPQYYTSFMLVPLTWALVDKRFVCASIISISMLLSTSTTAVVLVPLSIISFMIFHKIGGKSIIIVGCILLALFYIYTNSSWFEYGLTKLSNTEASTSGRLMLAPVLLEKLSAADMALGAPYLSIIQFAQNSGLSSLIVSGDFFVPIVWNVLITYGIIGLFLYYSMFIRMAIYCRQLIPYVLCFLIQTFSNSDIMGSYLIYSLIFMSAMITIQNKQKSTT